MLNQQLILGSVYRLKFKGRFERHGVCTSPGVTCLHKGNGVYRLEQIATFRDLTLAGVDLEKNFFTPLGVSTAEFKAYFSDKPADEYEPEYVKKNVVSTAKAIVQIPDPEDPDVTKSVERVVTTTNEVFVESGKSILKNHADDSVAYARYPIYKFVDVVDNQDILYVPELTIDGFPEIDIHAYRDLSLVFHLGLFDKPALLDPMLLAIRERMSIYGIRPRHIKLYSTGTKWMNRDEYDKVKSLRLPAEMRTIPPDASPVTYEGNHVIVAGRLRQIKENPDPNNSDEISFDSVKGRDVTFDHLKFEHVVEPGERFKANTRYFEKNEDGNLLPLLNPVYTPIGDEIMQFEEVTATADMTDLYEKIFGEQNFVLLGHGETRNESYAYDEDKGDKPDQLTRLPDKYYYKKQVEETVTGGTSDGPITKYIPATLAEIQNASLPLYRLLVEKYKLALSPVVGKIYYKPRSRIVGGTGRFVSESYINPKVLQYLGMKFKYTNPNGMDKEMVLELADIISFASQVQATITLETPEAFKRWKGRWARWVEENGDQGVVVEGVIPESWDGKLAGKTVDILGQDGSASKELYFLKEGETDRNYYLRYSILMQEHSALLEKCAAYEQHIIAAANHVVPTT